MSPALRDRAEALFLELVDVPADAWPALLEVKCEGDLELKEEVSSLLGCHKEAGSFLDRQELLALTPDLIRPSEPPLVLGTRVGEYTIERVIGAGGMGVVYQARQEKPRRVVALKLVNSAIASPALLRRFGLEAEMLGRLQHPGIAQIFEAGAADAGEGALRRPFIAMELVPGPPLLEYAKQKGLPTRERVRLMAEVCHAVQHAHQRGVIHRDLKPQNILVDDHGRPKVLDFGVARAVGADVQATTVHTSVGQLIGTLPYMSPEQVLADPREIDTRSDVYALGVILFEMLTGKQPLDLANRSVPDAVSIIRNQDPMRLSSISRVYRGDLEVIVAKALEKDKRRRYQSAAELAADLEHYLAGEPIAAKVDSAFYVLKKQIRRHRGAVAAGIAAVIGLAAFAVYASVQSHRNSVLAAEERAARIEADEARDLARSRAEEMRRNLYVSAIGFAQAAQSLNDTGRLKSILASCPEDLRGWEWRYLTRSADTAGRSQAIPDGRMNSAISRDGSRIVRWHTEAPIIVEDGSTGEAIREIDLGGEWITAVRLNANGRMAVAGVEFGGLFVVDVETGDFRRFAMPYPWPVTPTALWPDGTKAIVVFQTSATTLQTLAVDLTTGKVLWEMPTDAVYYSAAVSPDGRRVALGDLAGNVVVMDQDGCAVGEPVATAGWARAVEFDSDSSRLAIGGNEGAVYVLDLETWRTARHKVFENKIWTMAWSPDGRHVAAAGTEGFIRVLDATTGRVAASHFGHDSTVNVISWLAGPGGILSSSLDKTRRWWPDPARPAQVSASFEGGVQSGAWSHDGKAFYVGLENGKILQVEPETLRVRREVARLQGAVNFIVASPDGSMLAACSDDGTAVVLDAMTFGEMSRFRSPTRRALSVSFSPDLRRVAVSGDHVALTMWDPRTGSLVAELPAHKTAATHAEYSPDGRTIAVAYYDNVIRLHDAETGKVVRELHGPTDWVIHAYFTPDGKRLVIGCNDGLIYLWDLEGDAPPRTLSGHQNGVFALTLSPDGKRAVSGGWDNTIRLWDIESGLELLTWRPHINANWVASFSPDGTRFISASKDGTARVWTTE